MRKKEQVLGCVARHREWTADPLIQGQYGDQQMVWLRVHLREDDPYHHVTSSSRGRRPSLTVVSEESLLCGEAMD